MASEPIFSICVCITTDALLKFDGDFDVDADTEVTYEQDLRVYLHCALVTRFGDKKDRSTLTPSQTQTIGVNTVQQEGLSVEGQPAARGEGGAVGPHVLDGAGLVVTWGPAPMNRHTRLKTLSSFIANAKTGPGAIAFYNVITSHNEVVAKVMFLQLCVILFTEAVSAKETPPQEGGTPQ